jgi:NADH:ubiquinone oxidoreductase subunit K
MTPVSTPLMVPLLAADSAATAVASSAMGMLQNGLLVGAILFTLGLVGILTRRNMIVMFLSAELMLQGVSVSLVSWSRYHGDWGGQMLVIFVLTVAACEAAVALVFVLQALPPIDTAATKWPTLTPAGVEPVRDEEALLEREHV